jgi:hypothetical protein
MSSNARSLILTLTIAAASLASMQTYARVEEITTRAPPPPRAETVPAARAGAIWAPGHWEWTGHFYSWVSGTWIVDRGGGYHWVADHWQRQGDSWYLITGRWER